MVEARWERLKPHEVEERFAAWPVLYLPYGMCEPHGPISALGLDGLKAAAICRLVAEKGGGLVAPTDWWHIHELGHYAAWGNREIGSPPRRWLTSVPPWVHFKNICYHVRIADQLGFKAAILFTGHYGPNWKDLKFLVEKLQPYTRTRLFGLPDFEAASPGFDGDGKVMDHAGKVETSLLWALEPDLVDLGKLPPPGTASPTGNFFALGPDAHQASAVVGAKLVSYEVNFLIEKAKALVNAYDRAEMPEKRLISFGDVERFWAEQIEPVLPQFASMDGYVTATEEVAAIPESSAWKAASQN